MFGFRVPAPDEAMLISGGRAGENGTPFKVVTGHGAFVVPFIRQASSSPWPCGRPRSPSSA
jgi:flotillin